MVKFEKALRADFSISYIGAYVGREHLQDTYLHVARGIIKSRIRVVFE